MAERFSASDSSSGGIKEWVRIPIMTLLFLSKTLNYKLLQSPSGKWVPVRAEMVLVIDLAWRAAYLAAQALYYKGS